MKIIYVTMFFRQDRSTIIIQALTLGNKKKEEQIKHKVSCRIKIKIRAGINETKKKKPMKKNQQTQKLVL